MARMDSVKNLTGLVEWYGRNDRLRRLANLVVSGGHIDAARSRDREEQAQIQRMHELMEAYELDGQVRWLGVQLEQRYGGPLEIIEHGKSGFHIDPNHGDGAAELMADFFERCRDEPDYWRTISNGVLARVKSRYTWTLYAERMMTLSRIYGFWKFVTNLERDETRRYLQMFYELQFRPLADSIAAADQAPP